MSYLLLPTKEGENEDYFSILQNIFPKNEYLIRAIYLSNCSMHDYMALNKVLIELSVIADMIKYDLSVPNKETAGLLLGKHFNGIIYIDEIDVGDQQANAVHVEISDEALTNAVIKVSSRDDGHVIVGWWHTHPGHTSFMSSTDVSTQSRYQKLFPDAIAIVIDTSKYEGNYIIDNLDFGLYHLEGGETLRLPYGIVRTHTDRMTLQDELAYMITGENRSIAQSRHRTPAPTSNSTLVKRKILDIDQVKATRRKLVDLQDQFPFEDFAMMKSVLDINEAIANGVEKEIPIDYDNILKEVEVSMHSIVSKIDLLEHYKRDSQQTRVLGFTLLAIAIEVAVVLAPRLFGFLF